MNPIGFVSFGSTTSTISVAEADGDLGASVIVSAASARAAIVEKRFQPKPQLFGKVVLLERMQQRDRRSERADKVRAFGAPVEVLFEILPYVSRQAAIDVVGQEGNNARAVGHVCNYRSKCINYDPRLYC